MLPMGPLSVSVMASPRDEAEFPTNKDTVVRHSETLLQNYSREGWDVPDASDGGSESISDLSYVFLCIHNIE